MKKANFLKILIMGLPSSGKTTLGNALLNKLTNNNYRVSFFNADSIRAIHNDWDFSYAGRLRQANRMYLLAKESEDNADFVICDFVCPKKEFRDIFKADYIIYMDTIVKSSYEDTNKIFEAPEKYDFRVTSKKAAEYADIIYSDLMLNYLFL